MNNMQIFLLQIIIFIGFLSCSNSEKSNDSTQSNTAIITDTIPSDTTTSEYPEIDKKYLLGKYQPENESLFVKVPQKYCIMRTEYIHKDVLEPFIAMYNAAAKEGITLGIVSAVRSFDTQKWLWNQRYYSSSNPEAVAQNVLNYLSMPGTSRHHWGTDIDLMNTKLYFYESEQGAKSYNWLVNHAAEFGFYQVYSAGRTKGYNEEKWHWSYMPVAKEFQKQYREKVTYDDINNFNGCETAVKLKVIEDYVFGIDSLLLQQF
jgi:zinc D-Ala-D-Ala carboxypeptidase